jgi:hypothetical protein
MGVPGRWRSLGWPLARLDVDDDSITIRLGPSRTRVAWSDVDALVRVGRFGWAVEIICVDRRRFRVEGLGPAALEVLAAAPADLWRHRRPTAAGLVWRERIRPRQPGG